MFADTLQIVEYIWIGVDVAAIEPLSHAPNLLGHSHSSSGQLLDEESQISGGTMTPYCYCQELIRTSLEAPSWLTEGVILKEAVLRGTASTSRNMTFRYYKQVHK